MSKELAFKPKARLLLQLGEQLIRNESIALMEIIKNSYDADASKVSISMKNVDDTKKGEIIIEDNGIGMDERIIEDVWMQPGSNYKSSLFEKRVRTVKYKRLPIGEKGIGRFGVHRLGQEIEIISKKEGKNEVYLKINWSKFEKDDFLSNIKVNLFERLPQYFLKGNTGTKIIINKLRKSWSRIEVRELYRSINTLNSPFKSYDSFEVDFSIDKKKWLEGLLSFDDIKKYALYYSIASIEGNEIKDFKYEFRPWDTMVKLNERKVEDKHIRMVKKIYDEEKRKNVYVDIDLNKSKIGKISFEILIFDRERRILSLGVTDRKGFDEYLNENGGIRVFRDGIRIYDYGEKSNDWLDLDIKRVNRPGETISNNLVMGAVYLDRESSTDLVEKTNREGFIENNALSEFILAIDFALNNILTYRSIDKNKVRTIYSNIDTNEPVTENLRELKNKIEKNIEKGEFKKELLKTIKNIDKDYKYIKEIYVKSASAGLSLSIVIHEVEKILAELVKIVEATGSRERIKFLVNHLDKIVNDYATIIKQSKKEKSNLKSLIDQSLFNLTYRIKAHNLNVIRSYEKYKENPVVTCAQNLVISVIMNIIDNSIFWINYANRQVKKLYITLTDEIPEHTSILIADNGPGFHISPEDAIKPFITEKPGGMGLGLHLADEVMNAQGGKLLFPEKFDFKLPVDLQNGAKILLAFKN